MIRWSREMAAALLSLAALSAFAQTCPTTGAACTVTLNPGDNITAAVEARANGQTVCLNPGTYTPAATGSYGDATSFAIGRGVTVCGRGAGPANTVLQGGAGSDFAVKFTDYAAITSPNNATLANVRITNSNGGIQIYDFTVPAGRLSGITLRDLIVEPNFATGSAFGVLVRNADRVNIDNVTVASRQNAFYLLNSTETLLMNSTVTATGVAGAAGLAVDGGSDHVVVNNTFGSPKLNPALNSGYSIPGGNVVFYNTQRNRFENNIVQGHADDGLDFTAIDRSAVGIADAQATDNYAGKNTVVNTGFAAGRPGGSGIWSNCGSNGNWFFGNESYGAVECGLCVWRSQGNMVLGNRLHSNGIAGVVVSGGDETGGAFCSVNGGAFGVRPLRTFVQSNYAFFNKNDQIVVRNSDNTEISRNVLSQRNGFGGPLRGDCGLPPYCGSAVSVETLGSLPSSTGTRFVANTSHDNVRGLQSDDGKTFGITFAYNRMIQPDVSSFSRYNLLSGSTTWDGGPITGGNFWTQHAASGNPSSSTPYGTSGAGDATKGVFDSLSNTTGRIVDRYPFQSESFGKAYTVTVSEPMAGFSHARNTRKTVRWYAPACVYADISLDGTTSLGSNLPNTGYAVVTIPGGASVGAHTITVTCKDSAGVTRGSGNSASFNVTDGSVQIMAPGRDDVFNTGSTIVVGVKKTSPTSGISVDLSTDGGANFTTLGSTFTGTSARITLPAGASTANAVMRVRTATSSDYTDGYFAIRGTSGFGFSNVGAGRQFVMGQLERLEWASRQNSRLVDITATVGGVTRTVATNLADRGNFDWIVPESATGGLTLSITFKQTDGTVIGTASTNANGTVVLPAGAVIPANPPRLGNISTRMQVLTGNDVLIGGFVIGGSANKTVVVRARGPSLAAFGITNALANPTLQLVRSSDSATLAINDNWGSATNAAAITASGFAPSNSLEAAILMNLAPGAYTAIVSGVGGGTGVGIIEVFEVDGPDVPLANISTRGQVLTGNDVMIGGFVIQGDGPQTVVVRARGPSLAAFGITNALANPTLQLVRSSDSATLAINDNWGSATNAAAITASGFAPANSLESAILMTLDPGAYTAIVSGVGGGTGVGIIEVFVVP